MKKLIVVGVILLFIGLAVAPSINANVSKEALVEFTTEVCGFNGGKQIVKLTQEEAEEVEALFDSIREKLNATESREEAEEIFKEAVVELDKYGLLGGLSIKQAQRLVTGKNNYLKVLVYLKKKDIDFVNDHQSNFLCLIVGASDDTHFEGRIQKYCPRHLHILDILEAIEEWAEYRRYDRIEEFLERTYSKYFYFLLYRCSIVEIFYLINPISLSYRIGLGAKGYFPGEHYSSPAHGWITSFGVKGKQIWKSPMWGQLTLKPFPVFDHCLDTYPGVQDFTGIKLSFYNENEWNVKAFFIGFALKIKIGTEQPHL